MYKVSIIVPVYNAENYLRACLESLASQTLEDIEIIVVDDGSTDRSLAVAREFELTPPPDRCRFRVFHTGNRGVSCARNYGAQVSSGSYLVFVDADDIVEPDYCQALYEKAARDGNDLVICRFDRTDRKKDGTVVTSQVPWRYVDEDNFRLIDQPHILARINGEVWNKLIERDLFFKSQFPPGVRFSQDMEFIVEVLCLAKNIGSVDSVLYHYKCDTDGISGRICEEKLDLIRSRQMMIDFLQNNGLFSAYSNELECICARGCIGMYPPLLQKNDRIWKLRIRIIRETQDFLRRTFPRWKDNPYIRDIRSKRCQDWPSLQTYSPYYGKTHLIGLVLVSRIMPERIWDFCFRVDRKLAHWHWRWLMFRSRL